MKKVLSIIMALVMVMSLTVAIAAEEVLVSEDTMFFSNGNWEQFETQISTADFVAALETPGAYFVITRGSAATGELAYTAGGWEKFNILDSWWSGNYPVADGSTCQWIALGTANHDIAVTTEGGQPYDVHIDCVLDDGIKVWYNAADILAAWTAGGYNTSGANLIVISNSSPDDVYDIVNVAVVVPDAPIEAPAEEEAPADDTPAVEETPVVTIVEETIFSITTNTSDNDNNGKAIADCTLVGDWYSDKFATSWKDGATWTNLIDALSTEGATLKITCDGNVTKLGFQSDLANNEVAVTTADGVATIACADVLAGCADALADGYSWCNFIISGDAGTTITAIEVVAQVEVTEDAPVVDTDDAETEEPADTGLALAIVPMVVAMAAVALSKKR